MIPDTRYVLIKNVRRSAKRAGSKQVRVPWYYCGHMSTDSFGNSTWLDMNKKKKEYVDIWDSFKKRVMCTESE